ncbi:MAG: hypothetical protein QOD39_3239 [Mycobacterium sp.]|nr:hypothetical protein [Mycobacterium sp.]
MLAAAAGAIAVRSSFDPTGGLAESVLVSRESAADRFATGPLRAQNSWPAMDLHINTPAPGAVGELDLRRDFGAVGDGVQDDAPTFLALAEAVNSGRVAPGSIVVLPPGRYRVVGNQTIIFRRPIVLRGAGTGETTVRIEYSAQRGVFLRASGEGMYLRHSTSLYEGRRERNAYPNAPFSAVQGVPGRGDVILTLERPDVFSAGDQVYLLCDDYGDEVVYRPNNRRADHFLLKQYLAVAAADGSALQLDTPLRHDFAGPAPRLYRWRPMAGFGIEHLTIEDGSDIPDTEEFNTFQAIDFDGVIDGWVWDVHFRNNTSIPLRVGRSRRVVVSECVFDGARHVGGGGNGYLPELYFSDDCLVEYCTSIAGRHALICNWSCWGNVFRCNRLIGTPNTETHGEYSVENLYLRNDCRGSRMDIGGGGDVVHGHDGPYNQLVENYARVQRVLRRNDREDRLFGNWHVERTVDMGSGTAIEDDHPVPAGWDDFPFTSFCGHDHAQTAEIARPG